MATPPLNTSEEVPPSPEMMSQDNNEDTLLQSLGSCLLDDIPFCSGTFPVQPTDLILFYGKDRNGAKRVDLLTASSEDLQSLCEACDAATFGRGDEDVLDEAYRKAGKLDIKHFATHFDPLRVPGLIDAIQYGLLLDANSTKGFTTELYKLNVYGKGAFFKSHKDTPRSELMFGSLVVVLPAAHEGGALNLEHQGRTWTFDAAQQLAVKGPENPCVAFIAFFSDVNHEVTEVTSGHRITITYNLYYSDSLAPYTPGLGGGSIESSEAAFRSAFVRALSDPGVLPNGGNLGFGLRYSYPIPASKPVDDLDVFKQHLKGQDAMVFKVCEELDLTAELYFLYFIEESLVLFDIKPEVNNDMLPEYFISTVRGLGGKIVELARPECYNEDYDDLAYPVKWVTPYTEYNRVRMDYIVYGNEAQKEYAYGSVCLVIAIGPPGQRQVTVNDTDKEKKKQRKERTAKITRADKPVFK